MMRRQCLRIRFERGTNFSVEKRIRYALSLFAACYGYPIADDGDLDADVVELYYGKAPPIGNASEPLWVPARYVLRELTEPAPEPKILTFDSEPICLFFGTDGQTSRPDWLGEIFEWVSGAHEYSIVERDPVGRIPYSSTVFGRYGIPPGKPHANLVMAWLEGVITRRGGLIPSKDGDEDQPHWIVSTHDFDYYYSGLWDALTRIVKNLGIALLIYRRWDFFFDNLKLMAELLRRSRPGDIGKRLMERGRALGFRSTCFIIAANRHRRDANYRAEDLAQVWRGLTEAGFSIGLHGSYQSIVETGTLPLETDGLRRAAGLPVEGGRQHWLRFDDYTKLFDGISRAQLRFDSTLGFSETPGFRNGLCHPFPPYDFRDERPHDFLEIPLVLMDASLIGMGPKAPTIMREVLSESRHWGWGGIAILWHNPLEPLHAPAPINRLFWEELAQCAENNEKWITGETLLELFGPRYRAAGLLAPSAHFF